MKLNPSDWKAGIPAELKQIPQWVNWQKVDGRPKFPAIPKTLKAAKANNPATWGTWEEAAKQYERHAENPNFGAGLMLGVDRAQRLVFVDFDHCLTPEGELQEWARGLVEPFIGRAYLEVSPSGDGLHAFFRATLELPPGKSGAKRKIGCPGGAPCKGACKHGAVEVYAERRFSTITGAVFRGSGQLAEAQPELDELLAALPALKQALFAVQEERAPFPVDASQEETIAAAQSALRVLDPDMDRDTWLKIGMGLKATLGDAGFKLWSDWSFCGDKFVSGDCETRWRSFQRGEVTIGTLFHTAQEQGWRPPRPTAAEDFAAFGDEYEANDGVDEDGDLLGALERDEYPSGSPQEWEACGLLLTRTGSGKNVSFKPSPGPANFGLYFQNHPRWAGRFRFNDRAKTVELDGRPVDEDHEIEELERYVSFFMRMSTCADEAQVYKAARRTAMRDCYDPVVDWFKTLEWDQKPRIDGMCEEIGLDCSSYAKRCLRRWMIGAVARAFRPGCEMQTMLVLQGVQGAKKSMFFKRLAVREEWYSESVIEMGTKDGQLQLLGPWIVEHGEMAGMDRAQVEKVKVFISEKNSRFRPPYEKSSKSFPRRVVLGATVNPAQFLYDQTGSRRFWVIAVLGEMRTEYLTPEIVAQLWAEAHQAYLAGETWWDVGDEVRETSARNQEHYSSSSFDEMVEKAAHRLEHYGATTALEVQEKVAELSGNRLNLSTKNAAFASVLERLGWTAHRMRLGLANPKRVWIAPGVNDDLRSVGEQALKRALSGGDFTETPPTNVVSINSTHGTGKAQ